MKNLISSSQIGGGILLVLSLLGCQRLEDRIDEVSSRVDGIESVIAAELETQLAAMGESLDKLEQTDTELKDYISVLQETADELRESISENDAKIAELEKSLDQAIKDIQNSDASTRGELEKQIAAAKADVLEQLASAKVAMESRLKQTESTIATLQDKDKELETKISELRTYIDKGISDTKDWASATFATLEQYNSIVSDISGIRDSIEKLESSIKLFENDLTGKVKQAVDDAISPVRDQMISEAAAAVVAGYTEAISSVKAELAELASRVKKLEEDVRLIKEDIDNIKNEIEEINEKIDGQQALNRMQLFCLDGTVAMCYSSEDDGTIVPGEATMQFEVLPAEMADLLAQSWKSLLNLKAMYTVTKVNAGESIDLPVRSASAENGVLTITASGMNMDEAFFKKEMSASVRFVVNINGVEKSYKYVPMVASITNGIYIKDAEFKRYLVDNFDSNDDKEITQAEALSVKSINVNGATTAYKRMSSLDGLEYFTNLEQLDCSNQGLKEVNVSKNVGLKELYASGLCMSELDLSGITQLQILDITDNINSLRVICPSQSWLYKVSPFFNSSLLFVDIVGNELIDYVQIDGLKWSRRNAGSTAANPYGGEYTFGQAKKACPAGWRTPTKLELESLSAYYSEETTFNGMNGRWFSSSKAYTDIASAIFLPYFKGMSHGKYWSSIEVGNYYAYSLYFDSLGVSMKSSTYCSDSYFVRCLKN